MCVYDADKLRNYMAFYMDMEWHLVLLSFNHLNISSGLLLQSLCLEVSGLLL